MPRISGSSGWHIKYVREPRTIDPQTWVTEHYVAGRPRAYWGHRGLTEMIRPPRR